MKKDVTSFNADPVAQYYERLRDPLGTAIIQPYNMLRGSVRHPIYKKLTQLLSIFTSTEPRSAVTDTLLEMVRNLIKCKELEF